MIITFDLDGTISDPIVGVTKSVNYALEKLGCSPKDQAEVETLIGPPLWEIFSQLLGKDDDKLIRSGISFFRERYYRVGFMENILYPGITDLLEALVSDGHTLYIATNKKDTIAEAVADYFRISKYFKKILGCGLKRDKHELLNEIRKAEKSDRFVMIGDRLHDMKAGRSARFYCIGVLWGYGSREELSDAGADMICSTPKELYDDLRFTISDLRFQSARIVNQKS
ncbi:HAD-IA family hydrolase [Desulfococcaceae bacterium HSG8]|nr:HAD-IA family hydrolase [Desulfococcaceae bacterium HSG8]